MSALKHPIQSIRGARTLRPCFRARQCPFAADRQFHNAATTRLPDLQSEPPQSPPAPPSVNPPSDPFQITQETVEETEAATAKIPGSRRRRHALKTSQNIPFEQLPYQCFQEARKVLLEDRQEKLRLIQQQRERLARLQEQNVAESQKSQHAERIKSMAQYIERLKILADINDPLVKRTFEDGKGDMNKPIYRYLADKKWRSYKRLITMQRVEQMSLVPDVLPNIDPNMEVSLSFGRKTIQPGAFVPSRMSAVPPTLTIQPFDKGERLVTIIVVDPDVPNLAKDSFDHQCHYLAANIPISPTNTVVPLTLDPERRDTQLVLDWLPPFAQKGSPYHRIGVFVLEQAGNKPIDASTFTRVSPKAPAKRDNFSMRAFVGSHHLKAVGVHIFRTIWDEGTMEVMEKAGIVGTEVEYVRKRIPKLPYKKKDGARYR